MEFWDNYVSNISQNINLILTFGVYALSLVLVFNDSDIKEKKNWLIKGVDLLVSFLAINALILITFMFGLDQTGMDIQFYIVIPIFCFAHAFLMNRFSLSERIVDALTLSDFLVLNFRISLDLGFIMDLGTADILVVIAFAAVSVATMLIIKNKEEGKIFVPTMIVEGIMTVLIYFFVILFRFSIQSDDYTNYTMWLCLGLFVVTILQYYYYVQINAEYRKNLSKDAMLLQLENDKEMLEASVSNIEEVRKIRHDMKNQYNYMHMLLNNRDYGALEQFFSDLTETNFVPLHIVDCGNKVVSGIMNIEISKAKKVGLSIKHQLLVPKKIGIDDIDLHRFLTNIIDNAIEGTSMDEIRNAEIIVNVTCTNNYLQVFVSNPISDKIPPEERLKLKTKKTDSPIHGYGTKIIEEIVKKYDGYQKRYIEKGMFVVSAMLKQYELSEENHEPTGPESGNH